MLVTGFRIKALLYKIICGLYQAADIGRIHPMRERSLRALQRTVDYIERTMPDALGFESQRDLIEFSLSAVKIDGYYMEFGVYRGGTIRFIAKCVGRRVVHGFDSFEGLPAAWSGFSLRARSFDQKGRLPRVPRNVRLHPGTFDVSLPRWLDTNPGPIAFVHIDCNLYSSAHTVLSMIADRIVPGTILLFDEYFNFPNWEQHEFKAFQELVSAHKFNYRYIGFARQQVAVCIDLIDQKGK